MERTGPEWVDRLSLKLGVVAPTAEEQETLLNLAGLAAHASERTAAPISCWIAAKAGCSPDEALVAARALLEELEAEAPS